MEGDPEALGDAFLAQSHYGVDGSGENDMATGSGGEQGDASEGAEGEAIRDQDRFLPIANVARIMKNSVPKTGKIAKDAKECVQECVSEFISFITSEASERCHQEKRKTINGEDILFAMNTLGFDNYVEPLKQYLQKYRESMKGDNKMVGGADALVEELDEPFATGLSATSLATDPNQPNIIYAYTNQSQITQGTSFLG